MNKHKNIRTLLASATGSLLGLSATVEAQQGEGWKTDVAVLVYNETDRVSAFEPVISTKRTFDDESEMVFKLVLDSLTGASHNGASESTEVQTFTRPSGNGSYDTAVSEVPLDDTFRDTRVNFSASYLQPISRLQKIIYGGNVSKEFDFFSTAASATFLQDLNQRNTTLSVGVSFEFDVIDPVGGFATELTQMQASGSTQNKKSDTDTKTISEILLGVTQIIDQYTLMQFNYGFAVSSGYHNDPYKIVSVVDSNTGALITGDSLSGTYLYEKRPSSRTKHSLYTKVKRFISGDVADISYRYMWDDWDVVSHTLDSHYRFNISPSFYLEPHVRYYDQQAAEFYRYNISNIEANNLPENLSADYRLGNLTAITVGLKLGFLTANESPNSVRLEYYQQSGDEAPADLDALILQYNYRFK